MRVALGWVGRAISLEEMTVKKKTVIWRLGEEEEQNPWAREEQDQCFLESSKGNCALS